jgi:DNA-binding IclR family transcriptional regulator
MSSIRPENAGPAESGTVHRALRILSALADREAWALNELSRALQLPRASTHRLLNLCRPLGFVEQDDNGQYRAGSELYRIAGKLSAAAPVRRLAEPLLHAIRDEAQETATLTLLSSAQLQMFFADVAYPTNPLRYSVECNRLQPLAWGAAGHAILAWLTEDEIDEVIARQEASPLGQAAMPPQELREHLARVREAGFAQSFGQRAEDMHGIAVPFFDGAGRVRGNFMLSVPHFRYRADNTVKLVQLLRKSALDLAQQLGWSD